MRGSGFIEWPEAASIYAHRVDLLTWAYTGFLLALVLPVIVLLVVFVARYRRGQDADRTGRPTGNTWLEISWSIVPFVLALGFFGYAGWLYYLYSVPPADAYTINVVAKQWMWKFQHPGGQREINELHVPVGQPVKLEMISQDVIHSLFLPALRIKRDVLPGRYTTLWFEADRTGEFPIRCAEFCGVDHSDMGGRIVIMPAEGYQAWLERHDVDATLAAAGGQLFVRLGCSGCHGPAATVKAPDLNGIYGRPVPLADGRTIRADDRYLRDSILLPKSEVAAGYQPIMPSFANLVSEDQLLELIAYLKSLTSPAGASS